jgi:hypothetical protein
MQKGERREGEIREKYIYKTAHLQFFHEKEKA